MPVFFWEFHVRLIQEMKIWLAYKSHREGERDPFTSLLPVGLLTINAVLRKAGFDSRVANLSGMQRAAIMARLISDSPSVAGLSQFTHNRGETLELARMIKETLPHCFVILGGPHATFRWREMLESSPYVDAVAVGEGEQTMLDLVTSLAEGKNPLFPIPGLAVRKDDGSAVLACNRPLHENLDDIPLAGLYLEHSIGVDPRQQLEFIITSRGCPAACSFCSSPGFWGRRLRFRSPGSMIDEIRYLRDRFGLIYFSIRDDTFTADRKRVIDFCRSLIAERILILWNCQSRVTALDGEMLGWMKRAGCECIQLGIESGSIRLLRSLGKRITPAESHAAAQLVRDAGIRLSVYLIAGTLLEDQDDIAETCRLIRAMRPSDGQVSPLVYYPGTPLYEQGVNNGGIPSDLFERSASPSCLVRADREVAVSTKKLLAALDTAADESAFSAADYTRLKKSLGYCHSTNLMAGDYFAGCGDASSAEKEYREIITIEPDNPWGWLALGEFYGEEGRIPEAIEAFLRLCELVPAHEPAFSALGELFALAGDRKRSRQSLQRAKELRG